MQKPFSLLIKPAGPDCNIACDYCFYCKKKELFGAGAHRMSEQTAANLLRDYLALGFEINPITFQGGEPTLMGLDFYRRIMELERKYVRSGSQVVNSLMTNGILLDDEWCEFLASEKWLVGISLDGPKKFHDHFRKDASGNGTFDKVMASIERCKAKGVEFNVLSLVNSVNASAPDELFDFYVKEMGLAFLQFVPCVEYDKATEQVLDISVSAEQYGEFICRIFERWMDYGPEKLSVRLFDSTMHYLLTRRHTNCTFGRKCDDYMVVEHNGGCYCCDFYVDPELYIGNLNETKIGELSKSPVREKFAARKMKLAKECIVCKHSSICRGGCPKDRVPVDGNFLQPTYLCAGYKRFFDTAIDPLTKIMRQRGLMK